MDFKKNRDVKNARFNWQLPVDFIISTSSGGSIHRNTDRLTRFSNWFAALLPHQIPRMELGVGNMASDEYELENIS